MSDFQFEIDEVEYDIKVISYFVQEPNPRTWDSSDDYYGYSEFDCEIYDKAGNEVSSKLEIDDETYIEMEEEYVRITTQRNLP